MLDPKEQAKGGFRAHVAREQERQDHLASARRDADDAAASAADAPLTAEGQADGSPSPSSEPPADGGERSPYAPPAGRQPKRWR